MVITVEIYKQIRKMRLDGMSQRQIAAVLRISRNTVKKYWDGDSVPWERKDYSREASVLTEDVIAFVRQCLDEDAHNPRKQHHTAKRIYDRLVAECGFTGGETTVRRLVRELREKPQEAFVPLASMHWNTICLYWRRRDEPSSMQGRFRIPYLSISSSGYRNWTFHQKNWLRF